MKTVAAEAVSVIKVESEDEQAEYRDWLNKTRLLLDHGDVREEYCIERLHKHFSL